MHVTGNGSYGNSLKWFADSADSELPTASAWTLPLWFYKTLIDRVELSNVTSSFAMEQMKFTTALPINVYE